MLLFKIQGHFKAQTFPGTHFCITVVPGDLEKSANLLRVHENILFQGNYVQWNTSYLQFPGTIKVKTEL